MHIAENIHEYMFTAHHLHKHQRSKLSINSMGIALPASVKCCDGVRLIVQGSIVTGTVIAETRIIHLVRCMNAERRRRPFKSAYKIPSILHTSIRIRSQRVVCIYVRTTVRSPIVALYATFILPSLAKNTQSETTPVRGWSK